MTIPTPYRPSRPIPAEVYPLLSFNRNSHDSNEIARANSTLWSKLKDSKAKDGQEKDRIAIAIEWPEDRRLDKGKGKEGSFVIWVEKLDTAEVMMDQARLYVHPSLLPPFSITPLSVYVHHHEPFELSLAILQPVLEHPDDIQNSLKEDHIALSSLYSVSSSVDSDVIPNGDHSPHTSSASHAPIIRQNDHLPIQTHELRVLLLEPVSQGIITPSTKIILSTEPYILSSSHGEESIDGYQEDGVESNYSKSHMSLSDFDPDTFLSSDISLSLSLPSSASVPFEGEYLGQNGFGSGEEDGLVKSISSSTSGSLTPRPGDHRALSPPTPLDELVTEEVERGVRFTPLKAHGKSRQGEEGEQDNVLWLGFSGLGRAGIFEGDWVFLQPTHNGEASGSSSSQNGRLVKALAWERLDEYDEDLPSNPVLLPPSLYRSLLPSSDFIGGIIVQPTPFGARQPTLPIAKTVTLARIATAEGIDKRYERSWLKGLKSFFSARRKGKSKAMVGDDENRLIRRGDIISIPVYLSKPLSANEDPEEGSGNENEDEDEIYGSSSWNPKSKPTVIVYFTITSLSYDPLVPLEEDFRSSLSSKARAGELGCWFDINGGTKMVLTGVEKDRIGSRDGDLVWHDIDPIPLPFSTTAGTKLRDLLKTPFIHPTLSSLIQLSILVKGARGSGKRSLIRSIANELGYNIINVECYDIIGDTPAVTSGSLLARLQKAKLCSPSLLVLNHIEALAKKTESNVPGRPPAIVKVLEEVMTSAKFSIDWSVLVLGTTIDADSIPNELLGCFKQDVEIKAPNESERLSIINNSLTSYNISPDVDLRSIARQTAALHAGDIQSLLSRAYDLSFKRITPTGNTVKSALLAGILISAKDLNESINEARNSYSDSIGAPKIPNVTWDDVGGLANVKQDILDTVQLPLERPDLFSDGLKKRSGILLYGPPGTGKTLLAKAVATSCSLNFLSVKGPELLNMYIGESEANVRRLFQKARDASPCIIFMDELDSVAPKRGNQGDSGGVMDRIVSQLLAELDGMSGGSGGSQVFVMGATNRPDLLDSALLRPGRFDKLLYLNIPQTHKEQLNILKALTRKFTLDPSLDLGRDVVDALGFNYTGADLYALSSDSILNSMIRTAESIDQKTIELSTLVDEGKIKKSWKGQNLTTEYYLSNLATQDEVQVRVTREDFNKAITKLVPSVSKSELEHYERVQRQFKSFNMNKEDKDNDGESPYESGSVGGIKEEITAGGDDGDRGSTNGGIRSEEEDPIGRYVNGYQVDGITYPDEDGYDGKRKGRQVEIGENHINHDHSEQCMVDRKGKGKARQIDGEVEQDLNS